MGRSKRFQLDFMNKADLQGNLPRIILNASVLKKGGKKAMFKQ